MVLSLIISGQIGITLQRGNQLPIVSKSVQRN